MEKTDSRYGFRYEQTIESTCEMHIANLDNACPKCGYSLNSDYEICPKCGYKLVSYCTFCGAEMTPDEVVCSECGLPAEGIVCPRCGTRNFRGFCSKCGEPLTKAAFKAVEKANEDPVFQQAIELARKALELGEDLKSDNRKLSLAVPERGSLATPKAGASKETEYKRVVKDLNKLLEEMLPPAGSTPQQQRNYYSARKVAVVVKAVSKVPVEWICNYCGCTHPDPSDCYKPELGGKWIFKEVETTIKEYKRIDG